MTARVDVFYSLQSDYCYFLLDRLLMLANQGVDIAVCPVLGGVLRLPDCFKDRDSQEQSYFAADTARTADFLGLPYAYPDPSPIAFRSESVWIAEDHQPRNERLNRLYVGAAIAGKGLEFLDRVGRMLWDGSTPGWDQGQHLARAMADIGLDLEGVLAATPWPTAQAVLDENAAKMLNAGHWGVPLMVHLNEPFYGQDRFDQLVWRVTQGRSQ